MDLDIVNLSVINVPGHFGNLHTITQNQIKKGDTVVLDLPPYQYGFLFMGAICGEEIFEKALPIFYKMDWQINCKTPKTVTAGKTLPLTIKINKDPIEPPKLKRPDKRTQFIVKAYKALQKRSLVAVVVRDSRFHNYGGLVTKVTNSRIKDIGKCWQNISKRCNKKFSRLFIVGQLNVQVQYNEIEREHAPYFATSGGMSLGSIPAPRMSVGGTSSTSTIAI